MTDDGKSAVFLDIFPYPLGIQKKAGKPKKRIPVGAGQHITAGPYSPVLEIDANQLVVISGQAALNHQGEVVGDSIKEQTRVTIDNCINS